METDVDNIILMNSYKLIFMYKYLADPQHNRLENATH